MSTLWSIIRDFFVQNFFGGILSNGTKVNAGFVGDFYTGNSWYTGNVNNVYIALNGARGGVGTIENIALGDWLSTTFTIITFVLFFILIVLFVKWIFKVFSNALLIR